MIRCSKFLGGITKFHENRQQKYIEWSSLLDMFGAGWATSDSVFGRSTDGRGFLIDSWSRMHHQMQRSQEF